MNNQKRNGVLFALGTAVVSGVAIFYSKISVAKVEPLVLTMSRNLLVGAFFSMFIFIFSSRVKSSQKWSADTLKSLILVGIFGGGVPFYLFFTGLQLSSALTANYIHKSLFIWVSVLAFFFLKERMKWQYWLAYACLILAHFYFTPFKGGNMFGELMILAATIIWSVETIVAKKLLGEVEPDVLGLFRMGIGGVVMLLAVLVTGKGGLLLHLDWTQLSAIGIGGVLLFIYNLLWYRALRLVEASLATLILSLSVVVGFALNGMFAGVKIGQVEWSTSLSLLAGICIVALPNLLSQKKVASVQERQ